MVVLVNPVKFGKMADSVNKTVGFVNKTVGFVNKTVDSGNRTVDFGKRIGRSWRGMELKIEN